MDDSNPGPKLHFIAVLKKTQQQKSFDIQHQFQHLILSKWHDPHLCLGIGSGVPFSEPSEEVDEVLMLESDELLSLNLLSSETRRLEGSVFSVAGAKNEMN